MPVTTWWDPDGPAWLLQPAKIDMLAATTPIQRIVFMWSWTRGLLNWLRKSRTDNLRITVDIRSGHVVPYA